MYPDALGCLLPRALSPDTASEDLLFLDESLESVLPLLSVHRCKINLSRYFVKWAIPRKQM